MIDRTLTADATVEDARDWLREVRDHVAANVEDPLDRWSIREEAVQALDSVDAVSSPARMVDAALDGGPPGDAGDGVQRDRNVDPDRLLASGGAILDADDQLRLLQDSLKDQGFAGATEAAELVHVALCSRALERPLGLALHGPSAAGKTFTVKVTARHHPDDAVHDISAMSERYLAYAEFPTEHRYVCIAEASALHSDGVGATIIRELSWNRRLRYGTVVRSEDGPEAVTIERPGPTGLITTSTRPLDDEIATRLIAVHITDAPEQTRKVMTELARQAAGDGRSPDRAADLEPWHAASRWLVQAGDREVVVPYAHAVAEGVPTESVRMRRDFEQVMTVVRALAFMHQRTRPRDDQERVVATRDDYAHAHRLLAETMAVTLDRVSDAARETVDAVDRLNDDGGGGVSYQRLADELGLSRSGAYRRCQPLLGDGYLANTEDREGYPARLVTADALPEDRAVLPAPDDIPPSEYPPKSIQRTNADGESPEDPGQTTVERPDSTVGGVDSTGGGDCEGGVNGPTPRSDGENGGGVEPLTGDQGGLERGGDEDPDDNVRRCACGTPIPDGDARCRSCTSRIVEQDLALPDPDAVEQVGEAGPTSTWTPSTDGDGGGDP